ncbi:MAG TPA: ABC transporter ATP-binding protein [bacterium]|nr:ABC transporter ATP-binding protein [bacterium]
MAEIRRLAGYLRPYMVQLVGGLVAAILVAVAWLYVPRYVGYQIDAIIKTHGNFAVLNGAALVILAIYIFRSVCLYIQLSLLAFVGHRLVADLRLAAFRQVQRWSLDRFITWHSGEVISRTIQDTQLVESRLLNGLTDLLTTGLLVVGVVVALFLIQWRLALLTFGTIGALIVAARVFGHEVQQGSTRAQSRIAALTGVIKESITGARIIRAFVQETREEGRFGLENERTFEENYRIRRLIALEISLVSILNAFGLIFVLWAGVKYVSAGQMTPGGLVSFLAYLALAMDPAASLLRYYSESRQAMAGVVRVFELLDVPETVIQPPHAVRLKRLSGRVRFRNISLAYEPDRWALRNISLDVHPGEHIAVVGPSGAGKSSLVNLIPRFYDPTEGTIEVDDHDLRGVQTASLRRQIGLVPQETVLFAGTVADNIAYGRPDAPLKEIEDAARVAAAHDFISRLPDGYHTHLGEGGTQLSGGQRQRLALARAVLNDPAILILDEATSALDAESEEAIQQAMERLTEQRTTFIIAHRLSTVRSAHRIVVLLDGEVAEIGRHDDLAARDGPYSRLVRAQLIEETDRTPAAAP